MTHRMIVIVMTPTASIIAGLAIVFINVKLHALGRNQPSGIPALNTVTPCFSIMNSLLTIKDSHSGSSFLVGTGTEASTIPATLSNKLSLHKSSDTLLSFFQAADSTQIWGCEFASVVVHLSGRMFYADLLSADVDHPLLNANFLHWHKLLVDVSSHHLAKSGCPDFITCSFSAPSALQHLQPVFHLHDPFWNILKDSPALMEPKFTGCSPKHGIVHRIPTWVSLRGLVHITWMPTSYMQLNKYRLPWYIWVSFVPWAVSGPPFNIWWSIPTVNGDPVKAITTLTSLQCQIIMLYPTYKFSPHLLQVWMFFQRLISSRAPSSHGRHLQDSYHYPLWIAQIHLYALWLEELRSNFPVDDWLSP